jgi:hypothetical protein
MLMRRSIAITLLAAVASVVLPTTRLKAGFVPPDLPLGAQYQVLFVTSGTRDATSADVADYDAFVTVQAALDPSLPITTWHAVVSTATVNASVNAPSSGLPIYDTQGGQLVLIGGLYAAPLIHGPPDTDQNGLTLNAVVWTGSDYTGTGIIGETLGGGSEAAYGLSGQSGTQWAFTGVTPSSEHLSFYALSDPITQTVPEPCSFILAALGLIGLAVLSTREAVTGIAP